MEYLSSYQWLEFELKRTEHSARKSGSKLSDGLKGEDLEKIHRDVVDGWNSFKRSRFPSLEPLGLIKLHDMIGRKVDTGKRRTILFHRREHSVCIHPVTVDREFCILEWMVHAGFPIFTCQQYYLFSFKYHWHEYTFLFL